MEPPNNPYPTFDQHGFQLAVIEQGNTQRPLGRPLASPLASDERRFAAHPGDVVKLVCEYPEPMRARGSGVEYSAEHMWVKVTAYGNGCLIGELDNCPQYTKLLKAGDIIHFHPKHIIAFYEEGSSDPGPSVASSTSKDMAKKNIPPPALPEPWPFDQGPTVAAITSTHITRDGKPVMLVTHYQDDHSWGFQSGLPVTTADAQVVAMKEVWSLDPSIVEVADLEPGWSAERQYPGGPWSQYEDHFEEE